MPGLLGMDDDMQMALLASLLGAASASGVRPGTALARGGLLGMNVYQGRKADKAAGQRQAQEDEYRQWQMDEARRKAAADQERQAAMARAFQGAMIPGQPAQPPVEFGGGEGTRPGMPAQAPGFDYGKFAETIGPHDPSMAMQALGKLAPKEKTLKDTKTLMRGGQRVTVNFYTDGSHEIVPFDPDMEKAHFESTGGTVGIPLDPFTGAPRGAGMPATLSPNRPQQSTVVNNFPDLPKDHMWTDPADPRKGVVPIPGSATDLAAKQRRSGELQTGNIVLSKVAQARDIVKSSKVPVTGFIGGAALSLVPGTPSYDLARVVDTIKANVGFDALNQMRAQSPTGGALGQVSERENQYLQAKIANLETAQSNDQFMKALDEVEQAFNVVVHGSPFPGSAKQESQNASGTKKIKFSDLPRGK